MDNSLRWLLWHYVEKFTFTFGMITLGSMFTLTLLGVSKWFLTVLSVNMLCFVAHVFARNKVDRLTLVEFDQIVKDAKEKKDSDA